MTFLTFFYSLAEKYTTVYTALRSEGIRSPFPRKRGKKHKRRKEREKEGELVQIDASLHDWFLDGKKHALHGIIDDATHKIIALYFSARTSVSSVTIRR